MEIIILKGEEIFARTAPAAGLPEEYSMAFFDEIPEYPSEMPEAGKKWELQYSNGELSWGQVDRPLSTEERVAVLEQQLEAAKIIMGVE